MAFCSKCGKELKDGVKFCTGCGAETWIYADNSNETKHSVIYEKFEDLSNTPDTTSEFDFNDILNNKFLCVFAYLGILILIPIFAGKDSKFARFHANQGLVLMICAIILALVTSIISKLPIIGFIGGILSMIVSASIVLLEILGIVNSVKGRAKELPVIGKYRILNY